MKGLDLVGDRYGKLLVVAFAGIAAHRSKRSMRSWLCQCDCGKTTTVVGQDLRQGRTSSCGCNRRKSLDPSLKELYALYKSPARSSRKTFLLTLEDFATLIHANCCFYCGSHSSNLHRGYRQDLAYNGIDRMDNLRGYEPDNCVPCCDICNKAKRNLPLSKFLAWIKTIVEFYTRQI